MRLWKFSLIFFILVVFISWDVESKARKSKKTKRKKKGKDKKKSRKIVKDAAKKTDAINMVVAPKKPQGATEKRMCGTEPCCECTASYGRCETLLF